jgi:hypothetical protein
MLDRNSYGFGVACVPIYEFPRNIYRQLTTAGPCELRRDVCLNIEKSAPILIRKGGAMPPCVSFIAG